MFTNVAWMTHAACRTADPELFFPIGRGVLTPVQIAEARAVCERCPVRPECLRYAIDTNQRYGVWGGVDEDERRMMRGSVRASAGHGRRRG